MSESTPTGKNDPPRGRFVEVHNPQGLNPEHPENTHLRQQAEREYKLKMPGTRDVLEKLGVNPTLIDSVIAYVGAFPPMLGLIGGSPASDREGRGNYFDVPPPKGSEKEKNGHQAILYTKGSGDRDLLEEGRRYPGFPDSQDVTVDKIFHDSPNQGMLIPRIKGAASIYDAMGEFMNAAIVFAETAKRQEKEGKGWTDVKDAIDAGVTIPVGVLSLPELSKHQSNLVRRAIGKFDKDSEEYEFYSNSTLVNKKLAIVGLIVPGNKRRARENPERAEQILDKEIITTTARAMRRLIDSGIVYDRMSSHAQNMFTEGFMAQADNEDFVFLGDYDKPDERAMRIFEMLNVSRDGFLPFYHYDGPAPTAEGIGAQKEFFKVLLKDIVDEDIIERLPEVFNNNPAQVCFALSKLFVERSRSLSRGEPGSSAYWDQTSEDRKKVLRLYKIPFIKPAITRNVLSVFRRYVGKEDPIGVDIILRFLKSGELGGSEYFYTRLYEDVYEGIDDLEARNKLSLLMPEFRKSLRGVSFDESLHKSLADFMSDLINRQMYEEAGSVIETLTIINNTSAINGDEKMRYFNRIITAESISDISNEVKGLVNPYNA